MKRLLVALFVVAVLVPAAAPALGDGSWAVTATMGWTKYAMTGAQVGNRVYLVGDKMALHIYDLDTNTWSTGRVNPNNQIGPVVALGGKVYVLGGLSGQRLTGDCQVYDPATDTWSTVAPLPSPRGAGGAAVLNGKIHLLGGSGYQGATRVDLADHLVYDPVKNAWSSSAAMLTPRQALSLVADPTSGKLYAIGGFNSVSMNTSNANEAYDSATNTWTKEPPMPTARFGTGAALLNGKIYVVGGSTRREIFAADEAYDVTSATWTQRKPLPAARPNAYALAVGKRLYVAGGSVCQGSACYGTDRFWVSTPK